MKQISELKQGDKFYDIEFIQVKQYKYLCVHPTNKNYHILIDVNDEPIRIYGEKLQKILNKNLHSYQDAKNTLADELEEYAKRLRNEV